MIRAENLVVVPDLSSSELVVWVERQLDLYYLEHEYKAWDFIRDERRKIYEAITWSPKRVVTNNEVREHFKEFGADGNTAAFLIWIAAKEPNGWWMSIPIEENRLFWFDGLPCAPRFHCGEYRGLDFCRADDKEWGDRDSCSFVAFRERVLRTLY